jgi:hypothetical protein
LSAEQLPQPPAPTEAPATAPWFPPPTYPPPHPAPARRSDRAAALSVAAGIIGIVLGLATGLAGLILGPIAYFMGKASVRRIDESSGALAGRSTAVTAWVLGVAATIIGAVVSLFWIIVILEALSTPSA